VSAELNCGAAACNDSLERLIGSRKEGDGWAVWREDGVPHSCFGLGSNNPPRLGFRRRATWNRPVAIRWASEFKSVDGGDVRVVEGREDLRLTLEPGDPFGIAREPIG
jgi:hypothetical protein